MSLFLIATLLQGATAMPAPAPPPAAAVAPVKGRGTLFIAPSGEPFRGERGEAYPTATWFARADADHDGKLSRGEFRRDFMTYFPTLDVNGDSIIDSKEIARYEEQVVPEVRVGFGSGPEFRQMTGGGAATDAGGDEQPAQSKRPLPDLPRGGGRYGLINAPEPVVSADTDLNRRVTMQEYAAAADRRFTLLDPNEVGYLTMATLPKTPIQGRLEGGLFKKKR